MSRNRKFIPYPLAFKHLSERIAAKPEEFAGWVFLGKKLGGLDAYTNANELADPPRFHYSSFTGGQGYMAALASCWFTEASILAFRPSSEARFITGKALIERWQDAIPGVPAKHFIIAKIEESNLLDILPPTGTELEASWDSENSPPIEESLFILAHVEAIETSELGVTPSAPADEKPLEIPNPPKKADEWYLAIREMVAEFSRLHGRYPNEQEAWSRLRNSPPEMFGITYGIIGDSKKEAALHMDELHMTKTSFKQRWQRYFHVEA